ncbi:MAG TPA: nuclear transport factor 2 family protein [Solirubrobacterales bacterium]|nr:nuclear transport factor 2 family protein [Solirubrobacterales bacterium]
MSAEKLERVRAGIEAFNRRDFDAALALGSEDITWDRFLSRPESETPVVRGKDELRATWESQVETVDLRSEVEELIDVGEKVVALVRMTAHGSGSEISLTSTVAWLWSFDADGLINRVEVFPTLDEAIAAA